MTDENGVGHCITRRQAVVGWGLLAAAVLGVGLRPTEVLAADRVVTFPNGGSVTVHDDGTITGSCELTDCTCEWQSDGLCHYIGSNCHMPDGSVIWVECYERYIDAPNHERYAGPWNGTAPFTATPNGDGSYFVLVDSSNLPRCWLYDPVFGNPEWDEYPDWPSQYTYNLRGWVPPVTGRGFAAKSAAHEDWI